MNIKVILIFLVLITNVCLSQNTYPPSGPVGIGYTNPTYDLDINGTLPYIRVTLFILFSTEMLKN